MKLSLKQLLLLLSVWLFGSRSSVSAATAHPARGQVREGLSLTSKLLRQDVQYAVYLPPDYESSYRRYPVLYLLHGFTDDESAWIQFGEVNRAADEGIARGEVPPLIIVMPDGGVTWYVNDAEGQFPWESMFIEEMVPHIDITFRTRTDREFRAVSGLSMGGYGSLMLAMRHTDLFSACAAFSSGVHTDQEMLEMEDERYEEVFTTLYGKSLAGDQRLNDYYRNYNPLDLAKRLPVDHLKKVSWYIDCGDDDFLYKGNAALHVILREREVPHEYRIRDGAHNWTYWRTWIGEGLKFIGEVFHR